jgi:hypothetical protein
LTAPPPKSLRSSNWRERHPAGAVLLDRALGKATQPVVGADDESVADMHPVAVRKIAGKSPLSGNSAFRHEGELITQYRGHHAANSPDQESDDKADFLAQS